MIVNWHVNNNLSLNLIYINIYYNNRYILCASIHSIWIDVFDKYRFIVYTSISLFYINVSIYSLCMDIYSTCIDIFDMHQYIQYVSIYAICIVIFHRYRFISIYNQSLADKWMIHLYFKYIDQWVKPHNLYLFSTSSVLFGAVRFFPQSIDGALLDGKWHEQLGQVLGRQDITTGGSNCWRASWNGSFCAGTRLRRQRRLRQQQQQRLRLRCRWQCFSCCLFRFYFTAQNLVLSLTFMWLKAGKGCCGP